MSSLPTTQQLIAAVEAAEVTELERVRAAAVMADDLGTLGDQVVNHFVEAARQSGSSWSQIGTQLGVTKQAAQQAFVAPLARRGRFGRRPEARPRGRWSAEAKAAIIGAREEAAALGHHHVGTEHLLLALGEGPGRAAAALRALGVGQGALRESVVAVIGRGDGAPGHRPFTPRTKKVLELAVRESVRLQDAELRSEHLLLALVREGHGVAAQILVQQFSIDLPRVQEAVMALVRDAGPGTPGAPPTD